MRQAFFFLLFLVSVCLQGQNALEGTIRHYAGGRVYIQRIYGEKTMGIDSVVTSTDGHFRFDMPSSLVPGMYRVKWGKEEWVDLIWNQEDVRFVTSKNFPDDSLQVLSSIENKINLEYSTLDRINQKKLQYLIPLIDYYPVKDRFYESVLVEMEMVQKQQQLLLDSLTALYPKAFAVRMARVYQSPFVPALLEKEERVNFLKNHYFDQVDFTDTALLNSTVFVNKAISYLSLYSNNRLSQKQLEAEFIKAVTIMLSAASVNPEVFKFWLDYLVSGFDKFHFDEVITYMADNFEDPFSCEDQPRKTALQKKLETFKKLSPGNVAPPLEIRDAGGTMVRLSDIPSEFTLLVFWSTQCPHCTAMMDRLKELYDKQKTRRFEVVAVSIDTNRADWTGFIGEHRLNWINVSELKGFSGKSCDDYNIYATPTLFLLDRDKRIVAKPVSFYELEQALRDNRLME